MGPAGPNDGIYLNIAKARTQGLEVDLAYQADRKTRFTAALGLLDTEVVDFGSAANSARNGNQLGLSPRVSATVGASSEVAPGLTVGGNVSYVGKRFTDFDNLPEDRLDSHLLTNVHVQYRLSKSATLTGYVNNLFDKLVQTARFTSSNQAYFNAPRTVGVKLRMDF